MNDFFGKFGVSIFIWNFLFWVSLLIVLGIMVLTNQKIDPIDLPRAFIIITLTSYLCSILTAITADNE